jgi:transglutaminase-like putative cysteine protease
MKISIRWHIPRQLLILLLLILSACQLSPEIQSEVNPPSPKVQSQREYIIRQTLRLYNQGSGQPEKQNLWVALIRDIPPYQELITRNISSDKYELVIDEYGNEYAEFDFSEHPAGTDIQVEIEYEVIVYELSYDLEICEGTPIQEFTQPELRVESANPQIVAIAKSLTSKTINTCEQARAFYDYVGEELVYTYNRNDWGAQAALGPMGADCTEFSSLMMALSRAAGIPARYFEGLLYLDEETSGLAQTEHAWLDVNLPGVGWVAMDPTLGRSPIFEETYFAHHTPQHIIVTLGRNPSTLRGASYWSHLYWPGNSTDIRVTANWEITPLD